MRSVSRPSRNSAIADAPELDAAITRGHARGSRSEHKLSLPPPKLCQSRLLNWIDVDALGVDPVRSGLRSFARIVDTKQ